MALHWAPIKSPEALVSINFVLLLAAQAAIVTYGRTYGLSPLQPSWSRRRCRSYPRDLRLGRRHPGSPPRRPARDAGVGDPVPGARLRHGAELAARRRPRRAGRPRAVVRDNAASTILIVALPGDRAGRRSEPAGGGIGALLRLAVVPLVVFLLLVLPYYALTLPSTIGRYSASVWGIGESRVESVRAFWNMPFNVLLGGDSRLSGRVRVVLVTTALLLAAVVTTEILRRRRIVTIERERLRAPPMRCCWPAAPGSSPRCSSTTHPARVRRALAWCAVPAHPGWNCRDDRRTGRAVRREPGGDARIGPLVVGAGCAVLLLSAPLRMMMNQPKADGVDGINALRAAVRETADLAMDGQSPSWRTTRPAVTTSGTTRRWTTPWGSSSSS